MTDPKATVTLEADQAFLVVDDDETFRERLATALRKRGHLVHTAPSVNAAIAQAEAHPISHVVADLRMPGRSGLDLVRELVARQPDVRVLVLTAYGSIATAMEAVRLGAVNYLQKPANAEEILRAFERTELGPDDTTDAPGEVPSLARAEWEHINRVLTECNGSIRKAAKLLGLHRRTLQRKLAKFPVPR